MSVKLPGQWSRVVISKVEPEVDGGRFPAKRVVGDSVIVQAWAHADGHDKPSAELFWRRASERVFQSALMKPIAQDHFAASFPAEELGDYVFTVRAWVDAFRTWRFDLKRRVEVRQDVSVDLLIGADLVSAAEVRASGDARARLASMARLLRDPTMDGEARASAALGEELDALMVVYGQRGRVCDYRAELPVRVERQLARFSAWYELFPRSASAAEGQHGTFRDVERRLPEIAEMGFDIVYLPPIHPIGETLRKGPNNTAGTGPNDVGSPWAIGGREGGHKAIHPSLGTLAEFERLVQVARQRSLEIALDIAFQASPDHPYVREHPEWFKKRPDGSIQYAENPPKKYQDIYPFDFECDDWRGLWTELKSVFDYWIEHGVRVFRVDNPHTKPFAFWQWCLADIQTRHPDTVFLSEAFTRPPVMYHLAKIGFSQSYTYFPWRNGARELTEYFTELAAPPLVDFFRPNHWPNTPDILTQFLQQGGRAASVIRLVLAATLGSNYGIYGPTFELCDNRAVREGSEEYLDSEKYQIRYWSEDQRHSLRPLITRINRVRRLHAAFANERSIYFHPTDNPFLLAYSRLSSDETNAVLCIVNLDPHGRQTGWVDVHTHALKLSDAVGYEVHDTITDARYKWQAGRNYVELDPAVMPAHIFNVQREPSF